MLHFTLSMTAEDLSKGGITSKTCPIARIIRAHTGLHPRVEHDHIRLFDSPRKYSDNSALYVWRTTPKLHQWILNHDNQKDAEKKGKRIVKRVEPITIKTVRVHNGSFIDIKEG